MPDESKKGDKVYFAVWERTGVTEHMGSIQATKDLARMSKVAPGQLILDIGCGTGYTAVYLARDLGAKVVCLDITPGLLARARERIGREGLGDRISFVRADAHHLPFRSGVFDRAFAESVLVFCDKGRVSKEAYRVLKACGVFGDNELTFKKPPPAELAEILSPGRGLGMMPLMENEWLEIYKNAGFRPAGSSVRPVNFLTQLIDHIRVDGFIRYFTSAIKGSSDRRLKKEFFNLRMIRSASKFSSYVGYGLYVSEKTDDACVKD